MILSCSSRSVGLEVFLYLFFCFVKIHSLCGMVSAESRTLKKYVLYTRITQNHSIVVSPPRSQHELYSHLLNSMHPRGFQSCGVFVVLVFPFSIKFQQSSQQNPLVVVVRYYYHHHHIMKIVPIFILLLYIVNHF